MAGLVKHYQNTMKGIPQLTNNWGAMITLLDAVLVSGFNHVPVISVSKSTPTSITATINLGSGHGFIDRQVIRIAGSTNGWNGDYKVLSADSESILVECLPEQPSVVNGTATCFTAPLDFEIVFQTPADSIEPKRAYRSTDPESLGLILYIHDFCSSGAAATGAKFAKVGVVQEVGVGGEIIGNQMPFNPENPNANWGWDGTYHGEVKWYYRVLNDGWFADSKNATNGNTDFLICGNSVGFVYEYGTPTIRNCYGFLEFFDHSFLSKNVILLAHGVQGKYPQATELYREARSGISYLNEASNALYGANNSNLKGLLWCDVNGIYGQVKAGRPLYMTSGTFGIAELTLTDQMFYDFIILNGTKPVGVLPFIKGIITPVNSQGIDAKVGKYVARYSAIDNNLYIKYGLTLESE